MIEHLDQSKTLADLLHSFLNLALVKVKASGGSVMLLDQTRSELHIRARLGSPRETRMNEPVFDVHGKGFASKVVSERRPAICADVSKDPNFKITSGSPHFNSLVSVPIMSNDEVYGVINADHEDLNRFSQGDLECLDSLSKEFAKIVIERISVLEALRKITVELAREAPDGNIEKVLRLIADNILKALGADLVILYQYDPNSSQFIRTKEGTPTVAGDLFHPEFMKYPVHEADAPYKILKPGVLVFESDTDKSDSIDLKSQIHRRGEEHPDRERFCTREQVLSLAALPLICRRTDNDRDFIGVLFVNYRTKHVFSMDEKDALETFAEAAALAILNARKEDRNRKEKTGLYYRINADAHYLLNPDQEFLKHFGGSEELSFVMAVDIRRSTDLMLNATSAKSYVGFMSSLEQRLRDTVIRNYGIVDKFTGDGLIAHFPPFYSGEDAGMLCLRAATECHKEFSEVYEENTHCFQVVLSDVGLGIGIDFGNVHFTLKGEELIAVGSPVVYACRFSSVDPGQTVMNEQAARKLPSQRSDQPLYVKSRIKISLKHQGECWAIKVTPPLGGFVLENPPWFRSESFS